MKKGIVLGAFAGVFVLLIFSAWLLNAQFVNFQTRINSLVNVVNNLQGQINALNRQIGELESQISSLESQNSMLQNQTDSLEISNNLLVNQLGNLTEQLALARPIQVEIVSLTHFGYSNVVLDYVGFSVNVTMRNNDVVTVSGLTLTVDGYSGNERIGSTDYPSEINLLNPGEERLVRNQVAVRLSPLAMNMTYFATLKSGDVVLDKFTAL